MLIQTNNNGCAEHCAANYKNNAPNHQNSKINLLPNNDLNDMLHQCLEAYVWT
jgi:hypothetical protein